MKHRSLSIAAAIGSALLGFVSVAALAPIAEQSSRMATTTQESDDIAQAASDFGQAFKSHTAKIAPQVPKELFSDGRNVTLWGNVVYSRAWGESGETPMFNAYSYSTEQGLKVSTIASDKYMFANGSGAFYDGKFHMVSKGFTSYLYCEYDVATWAVTRKEFSATAFHKICATDCDYDPVTGLTYGCFWNPDTGEYEFASVDYESLTHNTIAQMEIFSAIAINSKGIVYGIKESDGCLYTIDKTTGEQKLIGSTGVTPYLIQSAAFDRKNDVMYWAVRQTGSVAYLATVNTDTGKAKRIAYLPDAEQITCLYIPWQSEAAAPAAISEYSATATNGTDELDISFTLPSCTYDGTPLPDSKLDYEIFINGESVKESQAKPSQTIKDRFSAKSGYNTITVKVRNSNGEAEPLEMRRWCGPETPMAVSDLEASIDNNSNNKVSLTWKTSCTGIHGAPIAESDLTFDIMRMPAGETVASGISGTSFTEELGNERAGVYSYIVIPKVGNIAGEKNVSNEINATGVYAVPYAQNFDTEASFNDFITIDCNEDNVKWFYNKDMRLIEYLNGWKGGADDYILTPEIYLMSGKLYELSFDWRGYDTYYTELIDISVGKGCDTGKFSEILPVTELKSADMKRKSVVFSVAESGAQRIAFHCTSGEYAMYVLIDNIEINEGPAPGAPGAVSDIMIQPDPDGHLSANISFEAPAVCADGSALSSITCIDVFREDGSIVSKITDVTPGKKVEFTDASPHTGINKYSVTVSNNAGTGLPVSGEAYVGQDIPWDPTSVSLVDNQTAYTISWETPPAYGSSSRRGPVIVEELKYNIYNPDMSLIQGNVDGNEYQITGDVLDGSQDMKSFYVSAVSPAGEGRPAMSNSIITGKPYQLPFRESFPAGRTPSSFWWTGGWNVFNLSVEESFDNDGGCICWKSNRWDTTTWFNSGKIDISPSENPVMSFAYRTLPGKNIKLMAYVSPEGKSDLLLGEIDFSNLSGEAEWQTADFSLAPYVDSNFVIVKIFLENNEPYEEGVQHNVYVDRIMVTDPTAANLSLTSFSVPEYSFVGQTSQLSVNVENQGIQAGTYKVNLYADDQLLESREYAGIDTQSSEHVTFDYTPGMQSAEKVTFRAEVEYAPDAFTYDNSSDSFEMLIRRPAYPVVDDLIVAENAGYPVLHWSEPIQDDGIIHESFEDYIHKDTAFGNWTTIDCDGGAVYSNQLVDIGYYNVPLSYTVFNSIAGGVSADDAKYYEAHDGTTSLIAIASQPGTYQKGDRNDDWLISPELSASVPHHLSLHAKSVKGDTYGLETFEILYTDGYPNDLNSFKSAGSFTAPQQWKQFSADFPSGTRFFAVRYTGEDLFIFMLDDFEFEIGKMKINGYNIYRNGVKIAHVTADTKTWTDESVNYNEYEKEDYHITVIYDNGESDFSNLGIYDKSGNVSEISSHELPADVFSIDGICVRKAATSLENLPAGIYIINGHKIIVRNN